MPIIVAAAVRNIVETPPMTVSAAMVRDRVRMDGHVVLEEPVTVIYLRLVPMEEEILAVVLAIQVAG